MPKDTFWDKATSNSEKIKPVTLAVIELYLSVGRQASRQAVRQADMQAGGQEVENSIE